MNICNAIIIISIIGFVYHWIKVSELPDDKKYMNWIYWLHIIVVFPLLFYVGRNCEKTERKYYELLLVVMFGALGYHTYNYFKYK
jgi:CDP-diglyceride synthetase